MQASNPVSAQCGVQEMSKSEENPLITFVLLTYNQDRYVREAVRGALSQTYSPLEIILSDDCSSDRTFDIIQEVAMKYTGPHKIRINRNEKNLGIGDHVNRIMELAKGELIVGAAGDDISLPERVRKTYEAYIRSDKKALAIYSRVILIDQKGEFKGVYERSTKSQTNLLEFLTTPSNVSVLGASLTWHRKVFDVLGPLLSGSITEDRPIAFRSMILGNIEYLKEALVLWRRHPNNYTRWLKSLNYDNIMAHTLKSCKANIYVLQNHLKDLKADRVYSYIDLPLKNKILAFIHEEMSLLKLEKSFIEGNFRKKLSVIIKGLKYKIKIIKLLKWSIRLFFPFLHKYYLYRIFKRRPDDFYINASRS